MHVLEHIGSPLSIDAHHQLSQIRNATRQLIHSYISSPSSWWMDNGFSFLFARTQPIDRLTLSLGVNRNRNPTKTNSNELNLDVRDDESSELWIRVFIAFVRLRQRKEKENFSRNSTIFVNERGMAHTHHSIVSIHSHSHTQFRVSKHSIITFLLVAYYESSFIFPISHAHPNTHARRPCGPESHIRTLRCYCPARFIYLFSSHFSGSNVVFA